MVSLISCLGSYGLEIDVQVRGQQRPHMSIVSGAMKLTIFGSGNLVEKWNSVRIASVGRARYRQLLNMHSSGSGLKV
jgi:hypothetical protein